MQRLEVSCVVRPIYGSLGAKGLNFFHMPNIHTRIGTVAVNSVMLVLNNLIFLPNYIGISENLSF
jgi:hypothetical protein